MTKTSTIRLTSSAAQLSFAVAGFLLVILLLESEGLANWAEHLDVGPLRTIAVPVTEVIRTSLHPLGLYAIRDGALVNLARVGWSDDVAAIAKATTSDNQESITQTSPPANTQSLARAPSPINNAKGADTPLVREVPRLTALPVLSPVEPGATRTVVLAGDSMMAVGLSSQLLRETAGNQRLHIVKAFRSGTGLARPEVFNWATEYPAMLGAEKPDVVLVAIGANDAQGFVESGKVLPYGTEAWRQIYQQRLAAYLAMISANGARVIWIGLPPMRVASYDDKMATINKIAYTVVSQSPNATWWNPVSYIGDENGRYREYLTQPNGKTIRLRQADGIHLSDEGAGLITGVMLKWLDPPQQAATSATAASPEPAKKP